MRAISSVRVETLAKSHFAFGFALVLGLALLALQERIGAAIWDGLIYVAIAKDPWKAVFVEGLTSHSVQRVLPSFVVHGMLRVLGVSLSEPHIIVAFACLHALQLALSAWYFVKASAQLGTSAHSTGRALLLFMTCFFTLKNVFVYPTLTDPSALLLGTALVYHYLARQPLGVCIVGLLGVTTWPLLPYLALPLLLFPRVPRTDEPSLETLVSMPPKPVLSLVAVVALGLAALAPFVFSHAIREFTVRFPSTVGFASVQYIPTLLPIAWLFALAYLVVALGVLWNSRELLRAGSWPSRSTLRGAAYVVVLLVVTRLWTGLGHREGHGHVLGVGDVLRYTLILSFAKPAIFVVAHVGFFGILWVMLATAWSSVCCHVRRCGSGLVLAVSLSLVLSLNCESRYLLACFPLVAVFAGPVLDERGVRLRAFWPLLVGNLVLSKAYLPMTEWDPKRSVRMLSSLYQASHGPWMTNKAWFFHVCLSMGALALLRWVGWVRFERAGFAPWLPARARIERVSRF